MYTCVFNYFTVFIKFSRELYSHVVREGSFKSKSVKLLEGMQGSVLGNVFTNSPGNGVSCGMTTLRVPSKSAEWEELQKDLSDRARNQHEMQCRETKHKMFHKGKFQLSFPHKIMDTEWVVTS